MAALDPAWKLADLDEHAHRAVVWLAEWLHTDAELLIAIARGRRAHGHYEYGDLRMYEFDQNRLMAEASEEIADAINYIALWLSRCEAGPAYPACPPDTIRPTHRFRLE